MTAGDDPAHGETGARAGIPHRRVYYFHGFDPATVARYRRIFEAASARLGVQLTDLPAGEGWRVVRDGVVTEVHHCRYEDLVRAWQGGPAWMRLARGLMSLIFYARDGALGRMARLGPRNLGLALSPVLVPLAVAAGLFAAFAVAVPGPKGALSGLVAAAAGVALIYPALYLHVVMDLFAYMRVLARAAGPVWRAYVDRIRIMSERIDAGGEPEILLVGHSLGGITALHALDALLGRLPPARKVGLLTLGSTHGTVLVQEGDGRDRLAGAIGRIAADRRVVWVDVSSPRDAFCLPLLDPLCLIDAGGAMRSPRVISARLARAPRIPGDRRTILAAMRRHMAYLLAPREGSGFDFADTISGRAGLAERFGGRGNSPKARMWRR